MGQKERRLRERTDLHVAGRLIDDDGNTHHCMVLNVSDTGVLIETGIGEVIPVDGRIVFAGRRHFYHKAWRKGGQAGLQLLDESAVKSLAPAATRAPSQRMSVAELRKIATRS